MTATMLVCDLKAEFYSKNPFFLFADDDDGVWCKAQSTTTEKNPEVSCSVFLIKSSVCGFKKSERKTEREVECCMYVECM